MMDYDVWEDDEPTLSTTIPMWIDDEPTAPVSFRTPDDIADRIRQQKEAAQCELEPTTN